MPAEHRPRSAAAWTALALVTTVLVLSSAAPFLRLGGGAPTVTAKDLAQTATYLVTWAPFVALVAAYVRGARDVVGQRWWTWVGHAALVATLPAAHTFAFYATSALLAGTPLPDATLLGNGGFQVITVLGTLQYVVLVALLQALAATRAAQRARAQTAQARLDALRAQVQPHFLFNTLNSISVLTQSDPAGARLMIRRLSELLRAVLADDDRQRVPLRDELRLLDAYVEIQRVRFGDRLRVLLDVDAAAQDVLVPTLILQPLVENAIRYAVAEREDGGAVRVRAHRVNGRLTLQVADDGADEESVPEAGHGVGLRNTRARLAELYGGAHTFDVARDAAGGCVVTLEVPALTLRESAP